MPYIDAVGREQEDLEWDEMKQEGPHEHGYEFNSSCAALVCACGDHKGLARCWCGWSKTDPGRGHQELAEMGENMEGLDAGYIDPSEVTVTSDEYFVTGITRRYT